MSTSNFITHSTSPLNAEPPLPTLTSNQITPTSRFYHRNHGPVPRDAEKAVNDQERDEWSFEVEVEGDLGLGGAGGKKRLTVKELKRGQEFVEETIAIQCAGNRRALFTHSSPSSSTEGIPWEEGTIANITFGGCLLRPLLLSLFPGLKELGQEGEKKTKDFHVIFESSQDCGEEEGGVFGGSVRGEVLLDEDAPIMLAWMQNSEPLTLEHGAPLRVVVPGIIGARSIKWLRSIKLSSQPSQHHAQQQDYKIIPFSPTADKPSSEEKSRLMEETEPMGWSPLQCVVGKAEVTGVEAGKVKVEGYGLGEKGVPITQIQLAFLHTDPTSLSETHAEPFNAEEHLTQLAEQQNDWKTIELNGKDDGKGKKKWDWDLWEFEGVVDGVEGEGWVVVARAVDANGQMQDRWPEWNLRGVGFDGWSVKPLTKAK